MEDQQRTQLIQFVQQAYRSGASIDAIRAQLISSGWRDDVIEPVLVDFQAARKQADPHRVRNAVFWMVGPFAVFIVQGLLWFIIRLFWIRNEDMGIIGIFRIVINIFAIIVGMIAVPMMIIGPVIGITKLIKK